MLDDSFANFSVEIIDSVILFSGRFTHILENSVGLLVFFLEKQAVSQVGMNWGVQKHFKFGILYFFWLLDYGDQF